MPESLPLLMDRAYEGNETRQLVLDLGMIPIVPPKSNRLHPWDYDPPSIKSATRSNGCSADSKVSAASSHVLRKLDVVFLAFLSFALIVEALRISVNTP